MPRKKTTKGIDETSKMLDNLVEAIRLGDAATPEPLPIKNPYPAIIDLVEQDLMILDTALPFNVVDDLRDRTRVGVLKYGTKLQPFNGRDVINDLYQELLDGMQYARQAIYQEQQGQQGPMPSLSALELGAIYRELISLVGRVACIRVKAVFDNKTESP